MKEFMRTGYLSEEIKAQIEAQVEDKEEDTKIEDKRRKFRL